MPYDEGNYQRRLILLPETSPVVKSLIITNVAVYIILVLFPQAVEFCFANFSLIPYTVTHHYEVWRLVTYLFLHGGTLHILFNMLFLWWFGSELERLWGPKVFLKYYFVTGIGGGLFHLLQPESPIPVIGASGAIMGILLAYGLKWPNRTVLLWFLIPIKMKWLVIISIVIELLGVINISRDTGIAHLAHLGGMVVGFLYLYFSRFRWWLRDIKYKREKAKHFSSFDIYKGGKDEFDEFFDDDDDSPTVH